MPRRAVVHLLTCVLALVTAVALLLAGATIGDAGGYAPAAPRDGAAEAAVYGFYDAVNHAIATGDLTVFAGVVAPDLVVHALAPGTTPDRAGLDRYLASLHAAVPDTRLAVEEVLTAGDRAMARVTVHDAGTAAFLGIPLADAPAVWSAFDTFRVADGRIVEYWAGADGPALLEPVAELPLGARLPPEPVVVLERLVVRPGQNVVVHIAQASRLVYVEAGTPTAWIAPSLAEPALLVRRQADGADGRPTEVSSGTGVTLSPGDLLALPAPTQFPIRNDADTEATMLVLAAFPADGAAPSTARPDPAYTPAGAGPPSPSQHVESVHPRTGVVAGPLAGVSAAHVAGGRAATLPAGATALALGRATLAPGTELRLDGADGPVLLSVEAGSVAFATHGGEAWATRGPHRASSDLAEGPLAAGDGALLQPGTGITLRNPGGEPLVVLVLALVADDARTAP